MRDEAWDKPFTPMGNVRIFWTPTGGDAAAGGRGAVEEPGRRRFSMRSSAGYIVGMGLLLLAVQTVGAPRIEGGEKPILPASTLAVLATAPGDLPTRLAASLQTSVNVHRTDHFVVVHTRDDAWAADMGGRLERLFDAFIRAADSAGFALNPPHEALTWVCFNERGDLDKYAVDFEGEAGSSFKSYYSSRTGRVLLLDAVPPEHRAGDNTPEHGSGTPRSESLCIAHEMAHQMAYHTGLQTRGVMYPLWVSEGLATFYEAALPSPGNGSTDNPLRRARLIEARDHGRLQDLATFALAARLPADAAAREDFYAQAWGLANLMMQHQREAFAGYLALLARLDGGRRPDAALAREFRSAFGDPEALESSWRGYLARLDTVPDAAPGRVMDASGAGLQAAARLAPSVGSTPATLQ
jgi:hypothetical protein